MIYDVFLEYEISTLLTKHLSQMLFIGYFYKTNLRRNSTSKLNYYHHGNI